MQMQAQDLNYCTVIWSEPVQLEGWNQIVSFLTGTVSVTIYSGLGFLCSYLSAISKLQKFSYTQVLKPLNYT